MTQGDPDRDQPGLFYQSARGRWVVAATVLGSGLALLDSTVVAIALPRIGKNFHVGVSALQWVVTGYTLTLAAFLLLGGTLGDRYGRRRVFAIGVAWFAVASAACAIAPTAGTLIAARALQGVGAALLTPGSLAILQSAFVPDDRSRAIGAWSGLGGLASAAGPLVGGYLLAIGSWRLVFLINLPVAAAVLEITRRHVPESTDSSASGRIDVPGAALAIIALSTLIYALIEASSDGWTAPVVLSCLAVGAVSTVTFVVVERRSSAPMLPPSMFVARQFAATNAVTFLMYGALGGSLFLLPVALQQVAGYTPLDAGLTLLPVTALMLLFSAASGRIAARIGPRLQMSAGPFVLGVGLLLLARLTDDHSYWTGVLPGTFLLGCGLVITVAPLTATAMSSAPGEHAGLASAVNNDVARAAGLFAVAVIPVASGLTGDAYLHPAVFAHGYRISSVIVALMCAGGAAIGAVAIRNPKRPRRTAAALPPPAGGATAPPLTAPASSRSDADDG
ncbi:MAG TPA: DHA2 family efflux MFS transporter permease subunit [Mycobacteriales bacterium]|nr:DHA2 family efflux MFS transporter permease subunit [Mycobacteriales bacterium]